MGGTRVYVGGLPYGVREKDLERFFKGYGRIRDVLIKNGYGFVEFDDYRDADDAVYELNGKDLLGERISVEMAHASRGRSPRGFRRDSRGGGGGGGRGGGGRDFDRGGPRRSSKVLVERARGVPRDGRDRGGRSGGGGGSMSRRGPPRGSDKYGPPTRTEYRLIVENLSSRVSWQDLKDYMRQSGEVTYADAHKQRRNEGVVEFASYSDMKAAIDKLDDTELNGRRIRLVEDRGSRGSGGGRGRRSRSSSGSRSRSRSRRRDSRSKSKSKSRSKSRSPRSKSRSKSKERSKSRSPSSKKKDSKSKSRSRSKSREKSRSRSVSKERDSRSRSKSPLENNDRSSETNDKDDAGDD